MICKLCRVHGRVQGVFYRASTQQKARQLQLTGYAKNCTDGTVEVLACGKTKDVTLLCEWLLQGPQYAQVDNVVCENHAFVTSDHFSAV